MEKRFEFRELLRELRTHALWEILKPLFSAGIVMPLTAVFEYAWNHRVSWLPIAASYGVAAPIVLFGYARLRRSRRVTPAVPGGDTSILESIGFDYLPDSPIKHGWTLAKEDGATVPSFAACQSPEGVSPALSIHPNGRYALDHDVPAHAASADGLKFAAKLSSNGRVYTLLRLTSQDGVTVKRDCWIQHSPQPGDESPDDATGAERVVSIPARRRLGTVRCAV